MDIHFSGYKPIAVADVICSGITCILQGVEEMKLMPIMTKFSQNKVVSVEWAVLWIIVWHSLNDNFILLSLHMPPLGMCSDPVSHIKK